MTVAVPAEQVEKEIGSRSCGSSRKDRQTAWFSAPGKAPIKVVENRYGKDVLNEVAGESDRQHICVKH